MPTKRACGPSASQNLRYLFALQYVRTGQGLLISGRPVQRGLGSQDPPPHPYMTRTYRTPCKTTIRYLQKPHSCPLPYLDSTCFLLFRLHASYRSYWSCREDWNGHHLPDTGGRRRVLRPQTSAAGESGVHLSRRTGQAP